MKIKISKTPVRGVSPREVRELRNYLLNNREIHHFRPELVKFVTDSALNAIKNNQQK